MPVIAAPLFVADAAKLKKKLRLSGAPTDGAADELIEEARLNARLRFYEELGAARVGELLAITEVALPATDDQVLRSLASTTEIKLVRHELLATMPSLFQDGSADQEEKWNEEAIFRGMDAEQLEALRSRLADEIEEALAILAGQVASTPKVRASTIDPGAPRELEYPPPVPFGSLDPDWEE